MFVRPVIANGICLALGTMILAACGFGAPSLSERGRPIDVGEHGFLFATSRGLVERFGTAEKVLVDLEPSWFVLDPAASHDGTRLAFVLQPPASADAKGNVDFGSDLHTSARNGSGRRVVVRHASQGEFINSPNWFPDGQRLVFSVRGTTAGRPDMRIETVDTASGQRQRLVESADQPALSRDGRLLAYVLHDEVNRRVQIVSRDMQTGQTRELTSVDTTQRLISELTWSPDGQTLAFVAADPTVRAPTAGGLHSMSGARHPTLQDVWIIEHGNAFPKRVLDVGAMQPSLAWSPDGSYLYVMAWAELSRLRLSDGAFEVVGEGELFAQVRVVAAQTRQ